MYALLLAVKACTDCLRLSLFLSPLLAPATLPPHFPTRFLPFANSWIPTLALWGGAGGGAVMLFMSSVPVFQQDILHKIPIVKGFFVG